MFDKLKRRIGLKLIRTAYRTAGTTSCANRFEITFRNKAEEVKVIVKDTSKPDAYSREEIYGMLKLVRLEERRTGWTCPEPVFISTAVITSDAITADKIT